MSMELTAQQKVERQKVERQTAHFDSIADAYHQARDQPNHRLLKQLIWRAALDHPSIAEFCGTRTQLDVLEPMCGFADGKTILETHLAVPLKYSGFDHSANVVNTLRADQPGLNVWKQDVTVYTPARETLDVIILLGGLHHVPDAAGRVVGNLAPALRPGGLFISFEPTYGNPLSKSVRQRIYRRNPLFDAATERDFSVRELMFLFENAGLNHIASSYPGLLAYVLYYNPDAFPLLNRGGPALVKTAFALDRPFLRTAIGRTLSFATISIWQQPPIPSPSP